MTQLRDKLLHSPAHLLCNQKTFLLCQEANRITKQPCLAKLMQLMPTTELSNTRVYECKS